jgi:transcriptional regulator with XRE-family HTH domain
VQGDEIRRAREERRMSRAELGHLVGVSESAVGLWERSEREPSYGHSQRLRAVLFGQGVPAVELDLPTRVAALEVEIRLLRELVTELAGARIEDDPAPPATL